MRWIIPNPTEGQKRTRRKFAWQKVIATDNEGRSVEIWLEWYLVTEEFHKYQKEIIEEWCIIDRKAITIKK